MLGSKPPELSHVGEIVLVFFLEKKIPTQMSRKGIDFEIWNIFYRLLQISSLIETVPGVLILRGDDTKKQNSEGDWDGLRGRKVW